MTLLFTLSGYGPAGAPPAVTVYLEDATVVRDDIGNYVKDDDIGFYAVPAFVEGGSIIGPVGILQWGKAQFGTTGILGYTPITIAVVQRLNVIKG